MKGFNMKEKKHFLQKPIFKTLGIIIGIILFLFFNSLLIKLNQTDAANVDLGWIVYNRSALCGIIAQLQVVTLVGLVVLFDKLGYITCVTLCIGASLYNLIPIIFMGKLNSLTGIIILVGTLTSTSIIYKYGKQFKLKVLEKVMQKEALHKMAFYDSLTGLANRRKVLDTLKTMTTLDDTKHAHFAVVFIDIDNFKKINDAAGHQKGDEILKLVTGCLKNSIHPDDLLGRLGGDEFALIVRSKQDERELLNYVEALKDTVIEEMNTYNNPFFVSASFGISLYPKDAKSADQLLKYADTAMYVAKSAGKNQVQCFNQKMHDELIHKITLENHLKNATKNNELSLVYQPQYTSGHKQLRGFETLIRWHSPELGFISPAEFIPIAEDTGLIVPIGEWVLRTACTTFKQLMDTYHFSAVLSINISVNQMIDPNFIKMFETVLEETQFPPHCLEIEITESIFISSKEHIISLLNQLKQMGIHIALDDFGTNYASLSYLQELPLDIIKIDKSFVDPIVDSKKQEHLVEAIISIAQRLDYKVVAEGIEDDEQLNLLKSHGCDYIQGYLWGRPLPLDQITELLQQLK